MDRKENYYVKATLVLDDFEIVNVPCKILLPERIYEKPDVIFKPTEEQAYKIWTSHKVRLSAIIRDSENNHGDLILEASAVNGLINNCIKWDTGIFDGTIQGEAQNLHIIRHLKRKQKNNNITYLIFRISQNELLSPSMIQTSSGIGDLKYERKNIKSFVLKNGIYIFFDKHFKSKNSENGDFLQWPYLVACAECEIPCNDLISIKNNMLSDMDDFLLISSFATRHRTVCLGWTASDDDSTSEFYRGDLVFPDKDANNDIDDCLVDIKYFERFVQACYSEFLKFDNKEALRNALHSLVSSSPQTLESSFLKEFAGLEAIILSYRREKSLEFLIQNKKEWATLKKYLKKCIKNSEDPKLDSKQRDSIYRKLDELNRISLREAFDLFCKDYSIDLSDLWPVFRFNNIEGLSEIRNKLIHGDPLPKNMVMALILAKEHLRFVLERVIVRVLKWDLQNTKINSDYLKSYHKRIMKDILPEQQKISDYIKSQNY